MVQQEFGNASLKLSSAEGAEPEASSPSYNDAGPAGAGKEIILIVEDDFLIAMEAENALADAGFRVSGVAATAEQALALAKKERPSVVVMDIRLAGARDGIDAAGDLYRELGLRCLFATANDDLRRESAPNLLRPSDGSPSHTRWGLWSLSSGTRWGSPTSLRRGSARKGCSRRGRGTPTV